MEAQSLPSRVDDNVKVATADSASFHCPVCQKLFTSDNVRWQHVNLEHVLRQVFQLKENRRCVCSSCGFIYSSHWKSCRRSRGIGNGRCGGLMVDPKESAWLSRMTEPCLSSETHTAERERATDIGHINEQPVSQFGVASFTKTLSNHYDRVLEGIQTASTPSFRPTDESDTSLAFMN